MSRSIFLTSMMIVAFHLWHVNLLKLLWALKPHSRQVGCPWAMSPVPSECLKLKIWARKVYSCACIGLTFVVLLDSLSPGWPQTSFAQDKLELIMPLPPKSWCYSPVTLCLAQKFFIKEMQVFLKGCRRYFAVNLLQTFIFLFALYV